MKEGILLKNKGEIKEDLSILFDLHKFNQNQRIQSLVHAVGMKYGIGSVDRELTDDELEVWAAGDPAVGHRVKEPGDGYE